MACYVGAVTFSKPTVWVDKEAPVVIGSDTRTRTGDMVSVRVTASQDFRTATVRFRWATYAQVQTIMGYWQNGGTYSLKPEDTDATIYTVRFRAADGVTGVQHEAWGQEAPKDKIAGTPTDLWRGEMNVILLSSTESTTSTTTT